MLSKHAPILPKQHLCDAINNGLMTLFNHELQKSIIRDDYLELIELSIIFLGGDNKSIIKIRIKLKKCAIQQTRWMVRAIYSFKTAVSVQIERYGETSIGRCFDVCLFIVAVYVKPWLGCTLVLKAPNQDLRFLKTLKEYEIV